MISTNENTGGDTITLATIEALTKDFATQYDLLASVIEDVQAAVQRAKDPYLEPLKDSLARAAKAKLLLHTTLAAAPELFKKPRTQIFHGVKVGYQKGKGGIAFEDADRVVELIKKHYGKNASAYLRTTEAPDIRMIELLPITELKKIGCTIVGTEDKVVIKSTESDLAKTVAALLKDAVESEVAS